jgi:3-hydroxyisobutyrate dehydrogenase-like beta-hydroxyacid dehydrogenase
MGETRWGVVGFGEVGSAFARQLGAAGQVVRVTDPILSVDPLPAALKARLKGLRLEVAPDIVSLMAASDVVLSVVTPLMAAGVAREAAGAAAQIPDASTGIFVDFNSISPAEKGRLAAHFPKGRYVDGAILGSMAAQGARAPLSLSGESAPSAAERLKVAGFDAAVAGSEVGAASALKMCRSIFMKGVECLFLETVLAAEKFGIRQAVLESVEQTFSSLGFAATVDTLLTTHAVHAGRRAGEMEKVVEMLAEMCLPGRMSAASREVLSISAASGLSEHVGGEVPTTPEVVTSYLSQFYRERCP